MNAAVHDPYYSRISGEWSFGERLEPVIHGKCPGPLGEAEVALYEERGYLVKPGLFGTAEAQALLAEAERLAGCADRVQEGVITEPSGDAMRSLFRVHREPGLFGRLAWDPRLLTVVQQLLGPSVYVHQSRINFKPAFAGQPFPWHSDFETWHAEDGMPKMRALSASLLLTLNTEHNGPLLVIPGSHRCFVRCVGETPVEHFKQSLQKQQYGVPDRAALDLLVRQFSIESATGPAGTVIFFDCNLMHGSGGNITPLPRHNVFLVYNRTDNALVEPFCGRPPRPTFLAERDSAPLPG